MTDHWRKELLSIIRSWRLQNLNPRSNNLKIVGVKNFDVNEKSSCGINCSHDLRIWVQWFSVSSDIDECARNGACHPLAQCKNTVGSYTCKCNPGTEGDGYNFCSKSSLTYQLSLSFEEVHHINWIRCPFILQDYINIKLVLDRFQPYFQNIYSRFYFNVHML